MLPLSTLPLFVAQQAAPGMSSAAYQMLPLLLMFAVLYFLVLRPMGKQEKDRKKRVEGLKKGDNVVLGGGILGRISNWDDPKVATIEIAEKVKVRVLKKDIVDARDHVLKDGDKAAATPDKSEGKATGA